jgi:hypothetical protein
MANAPPRRGLSEDKSRKLSANQDGYLFMLELFSRQPKVLQVAEGTGTSDSILTEIMRVFRLAAGE